jgi:cellulose synthase operon protein C
VKLSFAFAFLALSLALPLAAQAQPAASNDVQACAALKHHGDPNTRACFQRLTRSSDPVVQGEGFWALGDFKAANDAFRAAVKARPNDANARVRWGRMYLDHYQAADAADLFQEALELDKACAAALEKPAPIKVETSLQPGGGRGKNAPAPPAPAAKPEASDIDAPKQCAPALLGLARVAGENYEGQALKFAEAALNADPKLVEAQEVIAAVTLEDNNPQKAKAAAEKALEIDKESLDAMAILATIDLLADKNDTPWLPRLLAINPKYGEAYAIAAHFYIINRRYEEGIAAYRKALELDPTLMAARSDMGVNMMRLGQEDEARQQLELCYNGGYQSPETVNSLRLLDSYKDYVTFKTPTTILRLAKKEANLLRPYFQEQFERALATYEKKYKFKLQRPVQLEVYPNHEDFAVRTVSMPGIGGILGVTFGYDVAMDSPSGRKPGQWHWASTMWHELSHVYVLEMTNHRVPRWFTEGLAVYEETAASPDWGDRLDHESIMAIKENKLLPVAEIDRGFVHPTYPSQVIVSYFQGGKICTFIVQKWGWEKILAMIHDFGENRSTPEVIEKELGVKPEEFDKQFMAWLEPQVKNTVDHIEDWTKTIRAANEDYKAKKWDDIIPKAEQALAWYPDYVELGNPYEFLSVAWKEKGDKAKETQVLEQYSKIGGRDPDLLKVLAKLQSDAGRDKDAAATLERLNLIYLEDEVAHQMLGTIYMGLKNGAGAAREYTAVLAGKPVDLAGAHFGLAQALVLQNKIGDAREEVISALEVAPGFKPAQKLLLELSGKE